MLTAPLSSVTEWISTRANNASQTLTKEQHVLMLQACLALQSQRLLGIGSGGRSMTLSSMDLLARLRELRDDVCADAWKLALEAEYPHLERRGVNEPFRRPHPLVLGLTAVWAVDALGDRPTLRDRFAKAQLTYTMDKSERIARLWAVRALGNGCGKALDAEHLRAAAARLVPIVEEMLRDGFSSLRAEPCARLHGALRAVTGEMDSWRPEPRDVAELFETKTQSAHAYPHLHPPLVPADGLFRYSPQGLQGASFARSYNRPHRPPALRLPRPSLHSALGGMHTCRELLAPMWAKLNEQGVEQFEHFREAATNALPLAREWGETLLGLQPHIGDASAGLNRMPFVTHFQLPGRFAAGSDASSSSSSHLHASPRKIEDDWQLIDEIDD